jgi:hypothetical protein
VLWFLIWRRFSPQRTLVGADHLVQLLDPPKPQKSQRAGSESTRYCGSTHEPKDDQIVTSDRSLCRRSGEST